MPEFVLAFDIGTGSCKTSLWAPDGRCLGRASAAYPTVHHSDGRMEQRPEQWWGAMVSTARLALADAAVRPTDVACMAVSGHSLGTILVDEHGEALEDSVPLWSDARGEGAAEEFFRSADERGWYELTGNGFPAGLYPVFKMAWYKSSAPETWARAAGVLGTKDWIVRRLTGESITDPSTASGSGAFDLRRGVYNPELLAQLDIEEAFLPRIAPSSSIVGELGDRMAAELGLPAGTPVSGGGVDNSCMSTGSGSTSAGRSFLSLGSSSWAVLTVDQPIVDDIARPYTFASLTPGLYDSALSSFSAGSSLAWVQALLAGPSSSLSPADLISMAADSEPGARGVTFLPMLSGGAPIEGGPSARGSILGLEARHVAADIARAALEGTAFALARAYGMLQELATSESEIVITGGGSQDAWVRQLYADVLGRQIVTTSVGQHAAALGAAATGFVALGLWDRLDDVQRSRTVTARHSPNPMAHARYRDLLLDFDLRVRSEARRHV